MKNRKLIASIIGVAMTIPMMTIPVMADTNEIDINKANFPDDIFRKYISDNIDIDGNGKLNQSERNCNFINVEDMGISSLQGIEFFTNLTDLTCDKNKLTTLDMSNNPSLRWLACERNQLTYLNVSNNKSLEYLCCEYNDLTSLNINNNIALKQLDCYFNQLTELDVTNNTALETLSCSYNLLTKLDISKNTELKGLECDNNQLTSLDINNNKSLVSLECANNQLTSLDVSNNTELSNLKCYENQLTSLDISRNTKLEELFCYDNQLTSLDTSNNTDLIWLWCSYNKITNLDVSKNTSLRELWCNNNKLTNLDMSNLSNLMSFWCYENQLTSIDVSNIAELGTLICDDNIQINLSAKMQPLLNSAPEKCTTELKDYYDISNDFVIYENTLILVSDKTSGVEGFAKRLYTCALNRDYDKRGKDYWVDALQHGTTGADVARGFLFSPEVENANLSNDEFVRRVYLTLLDRVPADNEVAYWSGLLNDGNPRSVVFDGFINSQEWANVCLSYGILSGGMGVPSITVEPSQEIIEFANRLYTTCLCRNADKEGLMWWASELANLRVSGSQAAQSYFFSEEFIKANVNNREFVNRLYQTFMGRDAGEFEFDYWLGEMDKGMSRENVFAGFANSPEFGDICANYGIIR